MRLCGSMLPHNRIVHNDVFLPIFINATLARLSVSSLMMVVDRNMWEQFEDKF